MFLKKAFSTFKVYKVLNRNFKQTQVATTSSKFDLQWLF